MNSTFAVNISKEAISKWRRKLGKGSRVGILFLENDIRVRTVKANENLGKAVKHPIPAVRRSSKTDSGRIFD